MNADGDRLRRLGDSLRARFAERRERLLEERAAQVPSTEGIVYGPTRAEVVLAALRAIVYLPVVLLAEGFLITLTVGFETLERWTTGYFLPLPVALVGNAVAFVFFANLIVKVAPRRLVTVRARLFEAGSSEVWILLVVLVFYAVFAALIVWA